MKANLTKAEWDAYETRERQALDPIVKHQGISLDAVQVHTGGERYLMSGRKLVLTGTAKGGERVVVKASSDKEGAASIRHEKRVRDMLGSLAFSHDTLLMPEEVLYHDDGRAVVLITAFIEQPRVFVDRPVAEQLFLALRMFELQEGFQATTYGHEKQVRALFPILRAEEYLRRFSDFVKTVRDECKECGETLDALLRAHTFLKEHTVTIERYAPYLTHTDLVPHNMRVSTRDIYMLDYEAFYFGNKHESWARFLNYMLIHNPHLERMLVEYVRKNKSADEYLSLRLMRVFKIGLLLEYYARALLKTEGSLHELTKKRIAFWTNALQSVIKDEPLSDNVVEKYVAARNALRTPEEVARQKEFSIA